VKYEIEVKALHKPRHWEVTKEMTYGGLTVPVGFQFDGASIPMGLRWRYKHGGAKFPAAAFHDYVYRTGLWNKEQADTAFYCIMIENGVNRHDAKMMYLGVKWGGRLAWNKRRSQQATRREQNGRR
jgi:hypothetical protein